MQVRFLLGAPDFGGVQERFNCQVSKTLGPLSGHASSNLAPTAVGQRFKIPAVVFLTGACSLVVEIAAMRMLAPYFGNTIFTTSSVIGVVLGALSLGYFFGGKLSEKAKGENLFYLVIALAGVGTVVVKIFGGLLLPILGYKLDVVSGPLIFSLVLFFVPSALLGVVSPLGIKLHGLVNPKKGAGEVAGEIFFWSTAGSIAGSLAAGFVLIPFWGVGRIILFTGAGLALLGVFGLGKPALLVLVGAAIFLGQWQFMPEGAVYDRDGVYGRITIVDRFLGGKPVRYLIQDRNSMSGMYLGSDEDVFDYTKYFWVYRGIKPEVKRALFLGGGAYTLPKTLLKEQKSVAIEVVDVEPDLAGLAERYFRVPRDPRLTSYVRDGRRFLEETSVRYDLIFGDVYQSLSSIPAHMTTEEFFKLVSERLSPGGVFMVNVIGNLTPTFPSFTLSEIKTFRGVFANSFFLAVESPSSLKTQNMIFVGVNGAFDKPANIGDKIVDVGKYDLERYPVLTDDYSPVEYLTAKMLAD